MSWYNLYTSIYIYKLYIYEYTWYNVYMSTYLLSYLATNDLIRLFTLSSRWQHLAQTRLVQQCKPVWPSSRAPPPSRTRCSCVLRPRVRPRSPSPVPPLPSPPPRASPSPRHSRAAAFSRALPRA